MLRERDTAAVQALHRAAIPGYSQAAAAVPEGYQTEAPARM